MAIETPSRGTPALTGAGHGLDRGGGDMQWIRALRALNTRLREIGLETRLDGRIGAVDATLRGEGRARGENPRTQRTVLRPHRGELWWWLRSPDGHAEAPFLTPLTSAAHPSLAARRIRGLLASGRD